MFGMLYTIYDFQHGLLYHEGRFERILEPGQYRLSKSKDSVTVIDMRPVDLTISGQEMLTADNVGIKLSVVVTYKVVDPKLAANSSERFQDALYVRVQMALREIVGEFPIDDLLTARQTIAEQLTTRCAPAATALGLEWIDAGVKDINFPTELKRVFAQVVVAREEGLAALERARGESAAIRNLANAAKTFEGNPGLLQLRTLMAAEQGSGNHLVVHIDERESKKSATSSD
ncbi:MAG: slipin family protein [Chthonomonadales bacterium]